MSSPPTVRLRSDLLTNLVLVFPLFLIYQIGVLALPGVYNGADLVTTELLSLLHGQVGLYILVNLGLALAFVLVLLLRRRKHLSSTRLFVPMLLESTLYALTMGSLIIFVMQNILHVDPSLSVGGSHAGPLGNIILACGAGVHEELVFRLLLMGGTAALMTRLGFARSVALLVAFLLSATLFSAAHHIVGGEPWHLGVFVYRFLCGIIFALLYQTRGFAVAVYTHALYDIFVLTFH